jgi:predicted dinucleotide-binding enzyme
MCKPSTTETGSLPLILPQKDGTNLSDQWDPPEHAKHVTHWDAAACGTDVVIVAVRVDHIPQEMGLTTG